MPDRSDLAKPSDAAWDKVWTDDPYRRPSLRSERARSKVAAFIAMGLKIEAADRVLDLGCGSGHTLIEANEVARASSIRTGSVVAGRVVACDISKVATRLARENFQSAGLEVALFCADAAQLPLRDESFDIVLASMVLQHVHDEARVLSEIDRVLARGGRVFVVASCRRSITSGLQALRKHVTKTSLPADRQSYSAPQLVALMESRFAVTGWRLWHSGPDRRILGAIDRTLARILPLWGRYIVVAASPRSHSARRPRLCITKTEVT
jgi:ubiquinone/menaquinone biosynthesis C-methylase UbiE